MGDSGKKGGGEWGRTGKFTFPSLSEAAAPLSPQGQTTIALQKEAINVHTET